MPDTDPDPLDGSPAKMDIRPDEEAIIETAGRLLAMQASDRGLTDITLRCEAGGALCFIGWRRVPNTIYFASTIAGMIADIEQRDGATIQPKEAA